MGNRGGALHNQQQEIVRQHKGHLWITCLLEFKGRYRKVMTPGRYTELFFLDEAVAFAAGHRPCAECRRSRFNAFLWTPGDLGIPGPRARWCGRRSLTRSCTARGLGLETAKSPGRPRWTLSRMVVSWKSAAARISCGTMRYVSGRPSGTSRECLAPSIWS